MISIVSMVSIRVSIVSMVGISIVVWVTIVSIGSISGGLGISRPLAIEVSIMVGIWVSIVSMVGKMVSISIVSIKITSISTCFSFTGSSGEHAQGNNSNRSHHFVFAS